MLVFPDKLVVFDVETTDSSVGYPEIIEIGGVKLNKDLSFKDKFSMFVQPSALCGVTEFIEDLTGITRKQLESQLKWESCWKKWAEFTEYKNVLLGAWGVYFDGPVLRRAYEEVKLGFPHNGRMLDIKSMVYFVFSWLGMRGGKFSLDEVVKRLEFSWEGSAHRALVDAEMTAKVLREIVRFTELYK